MRHARPRAATIRADLAAGLRKDQGMRRDAAETEPFAVLRDARCACPQDEGRWLSLHSGLPAFMSAASIDGRTTRPCTKRFVGKLSIFLPENANSTARLTAGKQSQL
jgi:hypothetical protein